MNDFERKTLPKSGIDTENWFIESYQRHKGHPIQILIALYKGNYHKFVMAVICFFIKHRFNFILLRFISASCRSGWKCDQSRNDVSKR